jgi:Transposase, Mutator family
MEPTNQGEAPKLSQVIQIDEGKIQEHLGEVVRSTVEETLNAMLDAEADRLCRAERYERTEARKDTRAGSYQRHLQTKAGEVTFEGAEAAHAAVRDGDHRTLPAARKLSGRSAGGDVSCGSERTTSIQTRINNRT